MEDDDPFGMGAPPLAEPAAGGDDLAGFGDMPAADPLPPSDALPTFDDVPPPAAPVDMGGMDMGGGMPDMGGGMPDMGGGMPDMGGGGMGGMGGMDMGGGMGGGLSNDFAAPMEMGPVAKWRIEQQERVEAKAAAAKEAEAAKIAEAQAALAQFYAERTETNTKRASGNRAAEAEYVQQRDAAMIADSWESVAKLVDLKEKAGAEVDTNRMRSLLIQLKQ